MKKRDGIRNICLDAETDPLKMLLNQTGSCRHIWLCAGFECQNASQKTRKEI